MSAASTQPVRIGAIGAGFIADYHLAGLAAAGGAEVRVVCGRTPATTQALATRYGIPEIATDWRQVLGRKDLDAVVITTPDTTHAEIAIAAARAARVHLQVSFMHRYFEEVVRTREILAEGKVGKVFPCACATPHLDPIGRPGSSRAPLSAVAW